MKRRIELGRLCWRPPPSRLEEVSGEKHRLVSKLTISASVPPVASPDTFTRATGRSTQTIAWRTMGDTSGSMC